MNNKYELGQEVPVSCVLKITGISSTKNGSYVYSTDRSISIQENILEQVEMKPREKTLSEEPVAPQQEDKPKFKVGQKVKIVKPLKGCNCANGKVGIVTNKRSTNGLVPKLNEGVKLVNVESDGAVYCVNADGIEPYTEPEQEQEPIKLYCVKDDVSQGERWLTKGKIYEFDGHRVNYDNDKCLEFKDFEDWKKKDNGLASCLVPLVKRPAKVGEWVYVTGKRTDAGDEHNYKVNEIYKVFEVGEDNCVWFANDGNGNVIEQDYLILDGYAPEPEYYNGEVVCTEAFVDSFTVGRVYKFINGKVADNDGDDRPLEISDRVKSFGEWNGRFGHFISKFIPYKGKADK